MTAVQLPRDAVDQFLKTIRKPAQLLVAISGGSDSTGLLVMLSEALSSGQFPGVSLSAVTIDHQLRAASAQEARDVAALCARLGIPHLTRRWDGDKPLHGLAAAAREARYRLLCDVADSVAATAILSAHTGDDQAETIAMRAERNAVSGTIGLSGMADAVLLDRRHWLLRPFLRCRRDDIRQALGAARIGWFDDPSNADMTYERPRVRARLQRQGAAAALDPVAAGLRRSALMDAAADFLGRHLHVPSPVLALIDAAGLASVEREVLRAAVAVLASTIGGRSHSPGAESMTRILAFIGAGDAGCITTGRVAFDRRRSGLYLVRESRAIAPLTIAAGDAGLWDGRFRIVNKTGHALSVSAAGTDLRAALWPAFNGIPRGVAKRAAGAMPMLRGENAEGPAIFDFHGEIAEISVFIGTYDRFLPLFDLKLADALAIAFGRNAYLAPVHHLLTENAS